MIRQALLAMQQTLALIQIMQINQQERRKSFENCYLQNAIIYVVVGFIIYKWFSRFSTLSHFFFIFFIVMWYKKRVKECMCTARNHKHHNQVLIFEELIDDGMKNLNLEENHCMHRSQQPHCSNNTPGRRMRVSSV